MLPLIAVGGVVSAVASVIKGASWLSDKLHSSTSAAGAGSVSPTAKADSKVSPFEATLAAQVAGHTLPGSSAGATAAMIPMVSSMAPPIRGTDYGSLARMQAGLAAYDQIGQHHGNHTATAKLAEAKDDKSITLS